MADQAQLVTLATPKLHTHQLLGKRRPEAPSDVKLSASSTLQFAERAQATARAHKCQRESRNTPVSQDMLECRTDSVRVPWLHCENSSVRTEVRFMASMDLLKSHACGTILRVVNLSL